jgi:hypothetical protein
MCMIAAFIGKSDAMPHLVEMTRLQQAVFGGFYTGFSTIHEGRIYRDRVVGDLDTFLAQYQEGSLPGGMGLAHSRTNDGGGIEWAQPRLDQGNTISAVGFGVGGVLAVPYQTTALVQELVKEGVVFQTRIRGDKKNGIRLPDGSVIHGGEAYLAGVSRYYSEGYSLLSAIRKINLRSESVQLMICRKEPGTIFVINQNARLVIARTASGIKMANSKMAISEKPVWLMEIPPNTFCSVTADSVISEVLWEDEDRYDFSIPPLLDSEVIHYIRDNPGCTWWEIVTKTVSIRFRSDKANLSVQFAFGIIENLLESGLIRYEIRQVRGVDNQFPVPEMQFF